jgi:hypothetical protein
MTGEAVHDLAEFTMADMTELGIALRRAGDGARSMEETATRLVEHLYHELRVAVTEERACALVRFYKTHPLAEVPHDLQDFAQRLAGATPLRAETRCLTMLASVGSRPDWNARASSRGHQCIPLTSAEMVTGAPMIAQLVAQFGLDVQTVLAPDPAFLTHLGERSFNVFYVPRARGSPYIPAQEEFVVAEGIASVIGFGGVLPSGDLFTIILFSKVPIPQATADMFRTLALNVKLAILPFGAAVFAKGSTP